MPVDPALLTLFLVAVLVIAITPGPDMAYVLAHALSQGTLAGVVASLGMAIGMMVHTTAAALGLATLLQASPVAYDVIRYVGAAYLIYIGFQAWRSDPHGPEAEQRPVVPLRVVLWRAAATNVFNPKIVLFYVAFLPQFVDGQRGNVTAQFLILGLVFVIIGLLVDSAVALLGGHVNRWLKHRSPQRVLNRIAAAVFFGLAVRLIIP
ncbi:MAG TPA: LysE family translocator [Micromonosporaceae bacterium]